MRVEYDPDIRTMDDSIEKILGAVAAGAGRVGLGAAKLGAKAGLQAAKIGGKVAYQGAKAGVKAGVGAAKMGAKAAGKAVGAATDAVGSAAQTATSAAGNALSSVGSVASNAIGGGNGNDAAVSSAQQKVQQKEQELQQAQAELATMEQQAAKAPAPQEAQQNAPMPAVATAGKAIGGLDGNEGAGSPTEQPGTDAPPVVQVSKSFFMDNFGINGPELINLLEKGGETEMATSIVDLLRQEQKAVLKQFNWWQDEDWDMLQLKDNDFNMLVMHPDRLELPLRQTIVGVKKADTEIKKQEVWDKWHSRLDAENRLSRRERGILKECYDVLTKQGMMNSQALSANGVNASSSEIGSLIKSYGYLYDVNVVGRGTKHDDRTLYYDTPKPPIFLKKIDSFIGNLWEVDGSVDFTATGAPRLTLPFDTKRGEDYTVVLKQRLGVGGISWEGNQFVFEGSDTFEKAAEQAIPYIKKKKREASILVAAMNGNTNAGRILAYENNPNMQVELLKKWNVSEDTIDEWAQVITNG